PQPGWTPTRWSPGSSRSSVTEPPFSQVCQFPPIRVDPRARRPRLAAGPSDTYGGKMKSSRKLAALLAVLALVAAACTSDSDGTTTTAGGDGGSDGPAPGSVYDTVMSNDEVRCGTRADLPGFAVVNPDGSRTGFDVEFCKVVAAAVLGDAEKANLVDLATPDRFTALQSGQIDVLIRNTTWTAGRDGQEGATFLTTTFYDGQGMMVNAGEFSSIEDMDGVVVCSAGGTTTEGNAASEASRLGLDWEVRSFEDV